MGKSIKIKFHKETEKKRKRRIRQFKLKRILIMIIIVALFSFLTYYVGYVLFFQVENKSPLNKIENVQADVNIDKDSTFNFKNNVSQRTGINNSTGDLEEKNDLFLSKKIISNDTIWGYYGISISEWQHTVNWDSLYSENASCGLNLLLLRLLREQILLTNNIILIGKTLKIQILILEHAIFMI